MKGKRTPGNLENFILVEDEYRCKECGATAIVVPIRRSIHIKEMPGAGFGEVKRIDTPYCPHCEERPHDHEIPYEVPLATYFPDFFKPKIEK